MMAVKVSIVRSEDREAGIRAAVGLLGDECPDLAAKNVVLKPNFNSSDPFPASTHNDTTTAVIRLLQESGACSVTVAERSGGSRDSNQVADEKGVRPLFDALGVEYVVLDDLAPEDWVSVPLEGSHWQRDIEIPRLFLEAESIVMTCCLKTHAFGGHFTMSLKNAVGVVAHHSPFDSYPFMKELHASPHQRLMIAEINQAFSVDLIILDALSAFTTAGPSKGTVVHPGVMLASTDRVAIDAVGVAILRTYETTPEVMTGSIFCQDQIQRAAELGLGVTSASDIELVCASDEESVAWAQRVQAKLSES
ncbi:DUF362 domain-containing protein [Candidatus Bipolaricaulota bacterium]|nr:DUF362 domain-containing protein [Candidatus Bipolaricaulota bacterium]